MKHIYYLLIAALMVCLLPSCKDKNSPNDSGSYSGYAPDAKSLVGRWFDMRSNYVKFAWNGSSWVVKEGRMIEILRQGMTISNFSVGSGSITYQQVDGYTATLKWSIEYSYTSRTSYSGTSTQTGTDTGDLTLHFTSYQGGYSSGYMNGQYESYREFALQ
ncbi:MAG: hypothetical protein IJS13_07955 [Paludibacteraceae bacterium]|nr:hypothetical protein [Paludibacteraceae bacterium]